MKVALVSSRQDPAGKNIRRHIEGLLEEGTGSGQGRSYEFIEVGERLIHAEHAGSGSDADLLVFLSRHVSVRPEPVLTVHVTGNLGAAGAGGTPRTLPPAAPGMMQAVLCGLSRHCPEGYRVSYEVTHHGPTGLSSPSFFVEIGSTEKEWTDPVAGRAVALGVLTAAAGNPVPLAGFGGTHYAVRQTEIALTSRGAFGHIAHTREVGMLDEHLVRAMMEKSGAVAAYIDRKAIGREHLPVLTTLLEGLGVPQVSESEILAMGDLPWETFREIRTMAGQVCPGARCHIHALKGEGPPCTIRVDPVLFRETIRCGMADLFRELEHLPLAHLSTHEDRMLPLFITFPGHASRVIHDLNTLCVKIIRNTESTATENETLIIQKVRFDPQKARRLGVPAGPSWKHLAGGQDVRIDGRLITPDMVSSCSEIRIHIPGLETYP